MILQILNTQLVRERSEKEELKQDLRRREGECAQLLLTINRSHDVTKSLVFHRRFLIHK
jgi:hypothetical protein